MSIPFFIKPYRCDQTACIAGLSLLRRTIDTRCLSDNAYFLSNLSDWPMNLPATMAAFFARALPGESARISAGRTERMRWISGTYLYTSGIKTPPNPGRRFCLRTAVRLA